MMTCSNKTDLRRNAVVSVFLRTLEYYSVSSQYQKKELADNSRVYSSSLLIEWEVLILHSSLGSI